MVITNKTSQAAALLGSITTAKKSIAARANGAKGGRPSFRDVTVDGQPRIAKVWRGKVLSMSSGLASIGDRSRSISMLPHGSQVPFTWGGTVVDSLTGETLAV